MSTGAGHNPSENSMRIFGRGPQRMTETGKERSTPVRARDARPATGVPMTGAASWNTWTELASNGGNGGRIDLTMDRLKLLFDYAPYVYYLADLKGRFVDACLGLFRERNFKFE